MSKKILPYLILFLIVIGFAFSYFYAKKSVAIPADFHATQYTGAQSCKDCHEDKFDSWRKTYHSTMTQEANHESVVGHFDGKKYTYWGITVQPFKKNGKYYFSYYDPQTNQLLNTLEIKRTVGSRRYQQYLAQTDNTEGNYYRLELLWHIGDQRWVHLNGAFLGSDHQRFDNHTALWNQNCIFCHNTGIQPNMLNYDEILQNSKQGQALNLKVNSRFQSHVSDLGIGCESCHANGEEHVRLSQNPIRKYYLHFSDDSDLSIVHPEKVSAQKSMDICGQCHGQRTPKTFDMAKTWMETGPTYRPGDSLQDHVNPVWQSSKINNVQSDIFSLRFWKDGTPRLSAYEYQGLLQSQCHTKADLTCNDCHSMHEGNPEGMIKNENLTNKPCLQCHQNYAQNISAHTKHEENSDGSLCYNCHMPKIVYGLMDFHRSHKIESPNPSNEFALDKPNACAACHVDKTDTWITDKQQELWQNSEVTDFSHNNIIQTIYKLHSGDPAERGIAAKNMSYQSEILQVNKKYFLIPHLLFAMEDSYPAIRRFSHQTLMSIVSQLAVESQEFSDFLNIIKGFDFIENSSKRSEWSVDYWSYYNSIDKSQWQSPPEGALLDNEYQLKIDEIIKLRELALAQNKQIDIGE